MAHKWGQNVFDLGLGGIGATICSRLLSAPHMVLTNAAGAGVGTCQLWFISLDTDAPWSFTSPGLPGLGLNFPYGVAVEPDAPM